MPTSRNVPPAGRGRTVLAVLAGVCLLVWVAPSLLSLIAPAMIERAFDRRFAGSVRVHDLDLGWWSATSVGPVELLDPEGESVGRISARLDASLPRIVSERWWTRRPLAFGTLTLTGSVDVKRAADGRSNLQRALAGLPPSDRVGGGTRSLPERRSRPRRPIDGAVRFERLRVSIVDEGAPENSPLRSGIALEELSGTVALDALGDRWGGDSNLLGTVDDGSERTSLRIDGETVIDWSGDGSIATARADLEIDNLPVLLFDGLLGARGGLAEALGANVDATVRMSGGNGRGELSIDASSPQSNVDISLELSDGHLTAGRGARLALVSTSFLRVHPRVAEILRHLDVESWPPLHLEIERLRLPVGSFFETGSFDSVDWRGSMFEINAGVGEVVGRLRFTDVERAPQLVIEPGNLAFRTDDIAEGLEVSGGARATLDGEEAGASTVELSVENLIDDHGRATGASWIDGRIVQTNVDSDLLQTLLGGFDVGVDVERDIGPVVEEATVTLRAADDAERGGTDIELSARAANLTMGGRMWLGKRSLETVGEGIVLELHDVSPLLGRLVEPLAAALPPGSVPIGNAASARLRWSEAVLDHRPGAVEQPLSSSRLEVSLTGLAPDAVSDRGLDGVDLATRRIVREAIGEQVSMVAVVAADVPVRGVSLPFDVTIECSEASAQARVELSADGLRLDRPSAAVDIGPAAAGELLSALLNHPVRVHAGLRIEALPDPVTLGSGSARAGDYAIGLKGSMLRVSGLPVISPHRTLEIEPSGRLSIRADGELHNSVEGRLRETTEGGERDYGTLEVRVGFVPEDGRLELDFVLADLDPAIIDEVVGREGSAGEALGDQAAVVIRGRRRERGRSMHFAVDVQSPRVEVHDFRIDWDDERVFLPDPERVVWKPAKDLVGRKLMGRTGAVRKPPIFDIDIAKLAWARDGGKAAPIGPFHPDVFELDVSIASPKTVVEAAPGTEVVTRGIELHLHSEPAFRGLGFDLRAANAVGESSPVGPSGVSGTLANLADQRGFASFEDAILTATGSVHRVPSLLIDTLAGFNGAVGDIAGPFVELEVEARQLSRTGGAFDLKADSERCRVDAAGGVEDDTLIATSPLRLELFEIRPELMERLLVGLPFVSTFEKRREDGPGKVIGEDFRYPLDGDMRKLSGLAHIHLGKVRFQAEALLGKALRVTGATGDSIPREFKPFVVRAEKGVLSYDKYILPIGGEEIATSGTIDLVANTIDMVLYVPHLMLAEKLAGNVRTGISSLIPGNTLVLGSLTRLPIRFRGPLDDPEVSVDLKLFLQTNEDELKKAGGVLRKLPGRIFGN